MAEWCTTRSIAALQLATDLPKDQLQETAMFAALPAPPDPLRAFTIANGCNAGLR